MKSIIFLGKRTRPGSPKAQWPDAHLAGTTHSQQKYERRLGVVDNWDSWWDLHPFNETPWYAGIKKKRPKTYQWYQSLPGPGSPNYRPLWLLEPDPTIAAGVLFPVQEVLDAFPILGGNGAFYTCQVDWMCGWALLRKYEHIILHGHGVSQDPTHMVAHRGILYWVTLARARGVKVTVVPPSWYLAPEKPYGVAAGGWGLRK
jgi:hypothetical protein